MSIWAKIVPWVSSTPISVLRSANLSLLAENRGLYQERIERTLSVNTHRIGEQGKVAHKLQAKGDQPQKTEIRLRAPARWPGR